MKIAAYALVLVVFLSLHTACMTSDNSAEDEVKTEAPAENSATDSDPQLPDTFSTSAGRLQIHPVSHATMALDWNGMTFYVDPTGGAEAFSAFNAPDVILITDIHPDHMDTATLLALNTQQTTIIAPPAVAELLPSKFKGKVAPLSNGGTMNFNNLSIEAIPMYNLPQSPDAPHVKGRGNGYILTLGGKRIYIAGDTEGTDEMRALKDIDIAFIPMNLPYTMSVDDAAQAVLAFKPKVVFPYHYRGQDGLSDVERFKALVNDGNADIEVRLRNWYPEM